ncbi:hypothetical protein [Phormidium pseudopriestleyi]|uniref:hypothetical protein n=1 Tax=Phormidium pseudopriestleyi TaxID=1759527 RepID=UPI001F5CF9CD|nr:hypothetical protein [Phormidium pseudopriestleyi]
MELWCHSPIAITKSLKTEIDAIGPVRYLISPNKIHYAHMGGGVALWMKWYFFTARVALLILTDLAQLRRAFRWLGIGDDDGVRHYEQGGDGLS